MELMVDELRFTPRIPREWKQFKLDYRFRQTNYHLTCLNISGSWKIPAKIIVDGNETPEAVLKLVDDQYDHHVEFRF
jgi:cyclic beta-1,2-glucan synthetase